MPPDSVRNALAAVEAEFDVRVVAARDLGSRAWNLAGPASDYDVGIVFTQPVAAYATLGEYRASVEFEHGDRVEVSGWNARRFGELLVDSNPTALEFLHSPQTYREHDALARLATDVGEAFEPIRLYHHYRSLATSQYRTYIRRRLLDGEEPVYVIVDETESEYVVRPVGDGTEAAGESEADENSEASGNPGAAEGSDPRHQRLEKPVPYREATTDRTVKRNLYVVRAALFARYVRETHAFPPMNFLAFLHRAGEETGIDRETIRTARRLAERKRTGEGDAVVGDRTANALADLPAHVDPETHAVRGIDRERVNRFIRSVLDVK